MKGVLVPSPPELLDGARISSADWLVEVTRDQFSACPPGDSRWNLAEAESRIVEVMAPILTALGAEADATIEARVTSVEYFDPDNPAALLLPTGIVRAHADAYVVLAAGRETQARFVQRVEWVASDKIYSDMLKFLREAQAAQNPRPAAFKIVERLEVKFHGRKRARQELGVGEETFLLITRTQNRFVGDRHANYEVGNEPARVSPTERQRVLEAARTLIAAYERGVLLSPG